MRRGGPSLNPRGRPRVGESLAAALRHRLPPERIAELAVQLLAGDASADVRLAALDWIARRGYQCSLASMLKAAQRAAAQPQGGGA
jgi:hypothetical protein